MQSRIIKKHEKLIFEKLYAVATESKLYLTSLFPDVLYFALQMQFRIDQESGGCHQIPALGSIRFLRPYTYVLQQNHIEFDKKGLITNSPGVT